MTKLLQISPLWLVLIATLVAAILRLWQLGELPSTLHRDETAIGFNAYSLLLTGRDEHGEPWPLSFQSFGDFKLPGLIYTTAISIWLFELSPLSVRLPTALAAILTIPAAYWLSREIGWGKRVSLIAIMFLTFSFWHISQARGAYEPMVGLLLSVVAWSSWLRARTRPSWYLAAVIGYGVSSL